MKQYRPPLTEERAQMLKMAADELNKDALKPFTAHDVLNNWIDRGFLAMFPKAKIKSKRKKYHKFVE